MAVRKPSEILTEIKQDIALCQMSDEELGAALGLRLVAIDRMDPSDIANLRKTMDSSNRLQAKIALNALGRCEMLQIRENGMPQVDALMAAGWLFEMVSDDAEPWQWAWRRPKRRKSSKGMRFASTNQAYQALRKENPSLPEIHH